jgi:hypothetical protein
MDQNDGRDHTGEALPLEGAMRPEPPAAPAPTPTRKKRPRPRAPQGKARTRHNMRPEPPDDSAVAPPRKKGPGPQTPQGKARNRHNPTRFGIHSADPVIPGIESLAEWSVHREGVIVSLAPVESLEVNLAERVALLLWRLKRVIAYEQAEYARANEGHEDFRLPAGNELDKIMKYEAHLSRQLFQAKHELEVLQKQRRGEATPLARLAVSG